MIGSLIAATALAQAATAGGQPPPAPVQAPPRRMISGGILNDDYPAEALRAMAQGTTHARIDIDGPGRVVACSIARSAGHPALDQATCELVTRRFRYEPLPQSAGAARTNQDVRIAWRLPITLPQVPFAPARVEVKTTYGPTAPAHCVRSIQGQPPDSLFTFVCPPSATAAAPPRRPRLISRQVELLIADGRQLPWGLPRGNNPNEDYRLRFEVNDRGVITRCEPVQRWDMDPQTLAYARGRCASLVASGQALFQPGNAGEVRRGEYVLASHNAFR